jgi:hypothetical protein
VHVRPGMRRHGAAKSGAEACGEISAGSTHQRQG